MNFAYQKRAYEQYAEETPQFSSQSQKQLQQAQTVHQQHQMAPPQQLTVSSSYSGQWQQMAPPQQQQQFYEPTNQFNESSSNQFYAPSNQFCAQAMSFQAPDPFNYVPPQSSVASQSIESRETNRRPPPPLIENKDPYTMEMIKETRNSSLKSNKVFSIQLSSLNMSAPKDSKLEPQSKPCVTEKSTSKESSTGCEAIEKINHIKNETVQLPHHSHRSSLPISFFSSCSSDQSVDETTHSNLDNLNKSYQSLTFNQQPSTNNSGALENDMSEVNALLNSDGDFNQPMADNLNLSISTTTEMASIGSLSASANKYQLNKNIILNDESNKIQSIVSSLSTTASTSSGYSSSISSSKGTTSPIATTNGKKCISICSNSFSNAPSSPSSSMSNSLFSSLNNTTNNSHNGLINGQLSMLMINTPTGGLLSRSNSQPDLTINTQKPYSYMNDNLSNTDYYYSNQVMMLNSKSKIIGRHPSLSYKTSMSECNEEDDLLNSFNLFDYVNNQNENLSHFNSNSNNFSKEIISDNNNNNNNNNISIKNSNSNNNCQLNENYQRCAELKNLIPNDRKSNFNGLNSLNNWNENISSTSNINNNCTLTNNQINNSSVASILSSSSKTEAASIEDSIFLGTDALSDFLSNCGTFSDFIDDFPELEDLMSLVTFEASTSNINATITNSNTNSYFASTDAINNNNVNNDLSFSNQFYGPIKQTQCDLDLPNLISSSNFNNNVNSIIPYLEYAADDTICCSSINQSNGLNGDGCEHANGERTTRSAPPSPTPQRKRQRPTTSNTPWHKAWNKMTSEEKSRTIEFLTKLINEEMGLREQLEIIRILNPDTKLKRTDTQFTIDLKMIDDDKFRRIKEVIKLYGLSLHEKQMNDNSSDCSANSCPQTYQLIKRELRIKRAQQRLKLKQKKEQRQAKSGLFLMTEVVPLSQVLPEEDIEVDILNE